MSWEEIRIIKITNLKSVFLFFRRNKTTKGSEKNKRCKKYKVDFEQAAVKIFEKVLRKDPLYESAAEVADEKERQIQKLLTDELPDGIQSFIV